MSLVVLTAAPVRWRAEWQQLSTALDEQEAATLKRLADPQPWKQLTEGRNSPARDRLLVTLDFVERVRLQSAVPLLASHIGDGWVRPLGDAEYEGEFPVLGALVAIGEPAVPELLNRLGAGASEKHYRGTYSEYDLLIICIRQVYCVGGHGIEAARARIEAERAAAPPEKRAVWDRVLNHHSLRNETASD